VKEQGNMKGKLALFVVVATLLLMLVVPVSAITFGEIDNGEHPYVALVYFETPSGIYRCTGTLMSPTVVLTAGHCTSEAGVVNTRTWVTFDEVVNIPSDVLQLPDDEFGDWLDTQSNFVSGQAIPHPLYNDYAEFPSTYDIGVVILSEPVIMDTYGALPDENFLVQFTSGQGHRANTFEAVGYGRQGYIKPFAQADRVRYKGDVRLIELNSTSNAGLSAKFANNPGQGGGTCFGDSGGPIFYDDTNVVVAITSWGITPCIGVDYQFRIDTAFALAFLDTYL
jgi:hypothetical protein